MPRGLLLSLLLLSGGCATIPKEKDQAFTFAVEAVQENSFGIGANAAWRFVESADPDDPRYDRGLRLLAQSAQGLELQWAASMIFRQIAQARRNVELVPDALRGIQGIVESGVYDEDTLLTAFISSEEFSDLPEDLQAFVNYHHGLDLARRGADEWARKSFEKLPAHSDYFAAAQYVLAVQLVAEGDFPQAINSLEALLQLEELPPDLETKIERTLARLAFEEQRYKDALVHFETLRKLAPNDPEILLEMAWTHYYLGDSRKTLGLLTALDAPVHRDYISPERYLLEALSLRRLCQFGAARKAAVKLEHRYAKSLKKISAGILPQNIPQLRTAAKLRSISYDNSTFLTQLKKESRLLSSFKDDIGEGFHEFLSSLYERGISEATLKEEELIVRDLAQLTEELLSAREGVGLIIHELSVSLLRGRRRPAGAPEKPPVNVPMTGDRVFYSFTEEYWTDELDDLLVIAEDRCID